MNTIESILSQLTSNALVADVKAVLREQDPEFPPVETTFQESARALASRIGKEEAEKLLAAKEQQILSDSIFSRQRKTPQIGNNGVYCSFRRSGN